MVIKTRLGAQRYNNRMAKIWEKARQSGDLSEEKLGTTAERLEREERHRENVERLRTHIEGRFALQDEKLGRSDKDKLWIHREKKWNIKPKRKLW